MVISDGHRSDPSFVDLAIRLGLMATVVYWTLVIIRPLLAMIIWSVVLAVALYPLFEWLARVLGRRRRLAAVIVTVSCVLVVLGTYGVGWPEPGRERSSLFPASGTVETWASRAGRE